MPRSAATMAERLRPAMPEAGGDGGAVPIDHSLAPPAAPRRPRADPSLAAIDTRTTGEADEPVELAAAPAGPTGHPWHRCIRRRRRMSVRRCRCSVPTRDSPTAQKKARLAGMPGFDDGVARPLTLQPRRLHQGADLPRHRGLLRGPGRERDRPDRGGQVVINRVRSPFYPKNVCDVVYQGASSHRYGGCQFSFACDGIADRVTEPGPWRSARRWPAA